MRSYNVLWLVVIGTFFAVNFLMLRAAVTAPLLHGLLITDVQLSATAAAVVLLFRSHEKKNCIRSRRMLARRPLRGRPVFIIRALQIRV